MTSYRSERRAFDRLKADCTDETRREYEAALKVLVERYNTTIYENRFIAGGAIEVFTLALLRSVGIACQPYSDREPGGDILLEDDRRLSVKSSLTGLSSIKLINQLGGGVRAWTIPTLFIVAGTGIVFGAPDMVGTDGIRHTTDGLELRKPALVALAEDSSNVSEVEIPRKPPTETTGRSEKASTAVARQILTETGADSLAAALVSQL